MLGYFDMMDINRYKYIETSEIPKTDSWGTPYCIGICRA